MMLSKNIILCCIITFVYVILSIPNRGYILMNNKKPYRAAEALVISVNKADVIRTSVFFGPEDEFFSEDTAE